ncbi:MAG: WYL domain-containing protein [Burkholderiaceae bacterium]
MAKRPESQDTVALALELLKRIPRKRKVTTRELHQQLKHMGLERDLRTIQRQMEMLTEHFDIERDDRSKPYGYSWKEQSAGLTLPTLTEHESVMLLLAQQHLSTLLPTSLMKSMQGFFDQAHASVYGTQTPPAQRSREWLRKVRVVSTSQPLLPPKIANGIFDTVSNALYANRWLDIAYKNATGKLTEARVMPLGLAQQGPRLYLVCRFEGFDNERSLALHRFESATETPHVFEPPKSFDLQAYDDEGRFGVNTGRRVRLSFHITRASGLHIVESGLCSDQVVTVTESGYHIQATVPETDLLHKWLRSFGQEITHLQTSTCT